MKGRLARKLAIGVWLTVASCDEDSAAIHECSSGSQSDAIVVVSPAPLEVGDFVSLRVSDSAFENYRRWVWTIVDPSGSAIEPVPFSSANETNFLATDPGGYIVFLALGNSPSQEPATHCLELLVGARE